MSSAPAGTTGTRLSGGFPVVAVVTGADTYGTGVTACPGVRPWLRMGTPDGPKGKLEGGAVDVGLVWEETVVAAGGPGRGTPSSPPEASCGVRLCGAPALPCSLNSERSFSSRVLMSSIPDLVRLSSPSMD